MIVDLGKIIFDVTSWYFPFDNFRRLHKIYWFSNGLSDDGIVSANQPRIHKYIMEMKMSTRHV